MDGADVRPRSSPGSSGAFACVAVEVAAPGPNVGADAAAVMEARTETSPGPRQRLQALEALARRELAVLQADVVQESADVTYEALSLAWDLGLEVPR